MTALGIGMRPARMPHRKAAACPCDMCNTDIADRRSGMYHRVCEAHPESWFAGYDRIELTHKIPQPRTCTHSSNSASLEGTSLGTCVTQYLEQLPGPTECRNQSKEMLWRICSSIRLSSNRGPCTTLRQGILAARPNASKGPMAWSNNTCSLARNGQLRGGPSLEFCRLEF